MNPLKKLQHNETKNPRITAQAEKEDSFILSASSHPQASISQCKLDGISLARKGKSKWMAKAFLALCEAPALVSPHPKQQNWDV